MSANVAHMAVSQMQPPNPAIKVWRYFTFAKFVDFVMRESLFFARPDKLGDPFEGTWSRANEGQRQERYPDIVPEDLPKMNQDFRIAAHWMEQWLYVNCWHASDYDSPAMWLAYAKTSEAVAVQTTYERLTAAVPDNVYAGLVQYIDYERDVAPEDNLLHPFMHKRKSFEHEREIRLLTCDWSDLHKKEPNALQGKLIRVDIRNLIDVIYVAPTAPDWLVRLVEMIITKYDISKPVQRSPLDTPPLR